MKKRNPLFLALVVLMTNILVSGVSAGIFFSDLSSQYNLGDMISLEITVDPILEGYLVKTYLFCEGNPILEFNHLPDESGFVGVLLPLNIHTLNQVSGSCYFTSGYGGDLRTSPDFEISRRLNVGLYSDSYFVYPSEEVTISGSAERLNKALVNGEVEITIPLLQALEDVFEEEVEENTEETESSDNNSQNTIEEEVVEETIEEITEVENAGVYYGLVVDGEFFLTIRLRKDTPAGDYRIDVLVYEEIAGERASEGAAIASLKVFQVLSDIELVLNNQNINPGKNIDFKPRLLDQSGINIDEEVSVIIRNKDLERIYEKIVKSDETISFTLPSNLPSGYYEIESRNGDFNNFQTFYVNEKAIVSFELVNQTLLVENIGNIPYKKDIEIELSGKSFVKAINLELGEIQELKLAGSNEKYNVKISDGESEYSQSGVMLTGNAVNVNAAGEGLGIIGRPIVWIFLIVIMGIGSLFLFRNAFKKKSFAFSNRFKKSSNQRLEQVEPHSGVVHNRLPSHDKVKNVKDTEKEKSHHNAEKSEHKTTHNKTEHSIRHKKPELKRLHPAEQVLVMKGHRSRATAIVLKIKNKISNHSKKSLQKAVENVYHKKGAVYEQGDFIFIIFSPLLTRAHNNIIDAAKIAEQISMILLEHNKKFDEKIDFGIGINSGEIINKVDANKLKFTALGNFIVVAKRLADSSDKQILITKNSFESGEHDIKADKIGDGEVYRIKKVIDSASNKKFIQGFLDRMDKEAKGK